MPLLSAIILARANAYSRAIVMLSLSGTVPPVDQNVCPLISSKAQKKPYTTLPQEVAIPGNECIEQRNCFSSALNSALNIQNLAKYLTDQRGSSTMLGTSSWLGMQLQYPQACSLISWLTQLFHSTRNFLSPALSIAKQCLANKLSEDWLAWNSIQCNLHNKPLTN